MTLIPWHCCRPSVSVWTWLAPQTIMTCLSWRVPWTAFSTLLQGRWCASLFSQWCQELYCMVHQRTLIPLSRSYILCCCRRLSHNAENEGYKYSMSLSILYQITHRKLLDFCWLLLWESKEMVKTGYGALCHQGVWDTLRNTLCQWVVDY